MAKRITRLLLLSMVAFFYSCQSEQHQDRPHVLQGNAQGTTFSIKYYGEEIEGADVSMTKIFEEMDHNFSLWRDSSIISRWNNGETDLVVRHSVHFEFMLSRSKEINTITNNAFNPALHPVISAWGFSRKKGIEPSKEQIDSLMNYVDLYNWEIETNSKNEERMTLKNGKGSLDFNAIAQGYTVDVLAEFFLENNRNRFFIEVGGETLTHGLKPGNKKWVITLDKPIGKNLEHSAQDTIYISNKALVTSGNYRKTLEIEGKKYSHTIDPSTGYPVDHHLLSATVIANKCADADAFATAFMVMGLEKTKEFIKNSHHVDGVYLIYEEDGEIRSFISEGFESYLEP